LEICVQVFLLLLHSVVERSLQRLMVEKILVKCLGTVTLHVNRLHWKCLLEVWVRVVVLTGGQSLRLQWFVNKSNVLIGLAYLKSSFSNFLPKGSSGRYRLWIIVNLWKRQIVVFSFDYLHIFNWVQIVSDLPLGDWLFFHWHVLHYFL
jgi:hypothetical protein